MAFMCRYCPRLRWLYLLGMRIGVWVFLLEDVSIGGYAGYVWHIY